MSGMVEACVDVGCLMCCGSGWCSLVLFCDRRNIGVPIIVDLAVGFRYCVFGLGGTGITSRSLVRANWNAHILLGKGVVLNVLPGSDISRRLVA